MKKLLNYLVLGLLLLTVIPVFGQDEISVDPTFPSFWKFAIGFAIATFSGVLMDTIKHIFAGTFVFSMFWKDSLRPLLLAFGLGLVASAIQVFIPNTSFLVEMVAGQDILLDYETIGVIGASLSLFIKQLLKVPNTIAKYK
jgi:hypothetical protein